MCDMICGVYIVVFQGSGGGTMILWNHSHSWGHIFMHCQFFFSESWERYFVDDWFVPLQCKTIHYFGKRS